MANRKTSHPAFRFYLLQSKIANRNSTIPLRGHSSVGRAPALQAGSQGFESPCLQPWLAAVAESEDCRAVASAKADVFTLQPRRSELRLGKPTIKKWQSFSTSIFCRANSMLVDSILDQRT